MSWAHLEKLLTSEGEVFSPSELGDCLVSLLGKVTNDVEMASYDAAKFSELILGFENL